MLLFWTRACNLLDLEAQSGVEVFFFYGSRALHWKKTSWSPPESFSVKKRCVSASSWYSHILPLHRCWEKGGGEKN